MDLDTASAPTISVIIATYNRAHLLPRAVNSVLAQSRQDIEIIIVDDGSSDDTQEVVKGFRDPRIRAFRHPTNLGIGAAYNTGLLAARGALLAILDSDDRAEPIWLERLAAALEGDMNLGLAWGWLRTHYDNGRPSAIMYRTPFHTEPPQLLPTMLTWTPGTTGLMLRREVFEVLGEMETYARGLMTDLDYAIRFALSGRWGIHIQPEVLFHTYHHGGNTSATVGQRQFDMLMHIVRKHESALAAYPCTYAFYLYGLGRASEQFDRNAAGGYLRQAALRCPGVKKYKLYSFMHQLHIEPMWSAISTASSIRAYIRGRYREFMNRNPARSEI